ncbi:unnamed protein product, partial [Candidula unifasciata]
SSEVEIRCGYHTWRPQWLQSFNTPNFLVFFMGLYSLVLGFVVNGIHNVNISTIERRYDLDSTSMGFVSGSYDVSAAVLAVVIGYYGSGNRKPRLLSFGIFTSALGSCFMAMPHFISGTYALGTAPEKTCVSIHEANNTCAKDTDGTVNMYLYMLLFSQLLHGLGGTTLFTVGVSLVDDSVCSKKTPLYLGIIYGCNILGAGLGYIVGGKLLNFYIDYSAKDTVHLIPSDPRWLGAWWLGPSVAAFLQIITVIPISLFGAELPGAKEIRKTRVSQAHAPTSQIKYQHMHIVRMTIIVLRNPCFVFITLAMTMEGMFLSGTAAFLPKFIQNQYGTTASSAAILSGIAVVPAAGGGLVLGGYIAKRFNLTVRQIIKYLICTCTLATLGCSILWIRCDADDIFGVTVPYSGLIAPCNSICQCDTDSFEPVCNRDTKLYFSPCHAGCAVQKGTEFMNCSCVDELAAATDSPDMNRILTTEGCRLPCHLLYVFVFLLFCAMAVTFMAIAPGDSIQLRCVLEEHKVLAQGVKTLIVRMLGSFMGPILMGKLLDLRCEIWREKCGQQLSCWLYNQDGLVISIYFYILTLKLLALFFCILALKFYQPPPSLTKTILVKDPNSKSPVDQLSETDHFVMKPNYAKSD